MDSKVCVLCNKSMKSGGIVFAVNNGIAVHCECLENHCVKADCSKCIIGNDSDCVFADFKRALIEVSGGVYD
jgi:hypothetical protein